MEQINSQRPTLWSPYFKILLLVLLSLGFLTTFAAGFVLSSLLRVENQPPAQNHPVTIPTVTSSPTTQPYSDNGEITSFLPGKFYFDDTVIAFTKNAPHKAFVASMRRVQQESGYTESTGISFFDGSKWIRKTQSRATANASFNPNQYIKSWVTTFDPSRVLKETMTGTFAIENSIIEISSDMLHNEIGMRSLPGYTKFMSTGNARVTINGASEPAHLLYTRIYSLNASDIQFYNQPLGLTTDWIAVWDTQDTFYHVDKTTVDKTTNIYQTHAIGVVDTNTQTVTKTFTVNVTRSLDKPPTTVSVILGTPIDTTLSLIRLNANNKAPNNNYTWVMGTVEGTVQVNGSQRNVSGLMEYIYNE